MLIPILSLLSVLAGVDNGSLSTQENIPLDRHSPTDIAFTDNDNILIQDLLNDGGEIVLEPNRIYNITEPLVVKKSGTKIDGNNAMIRYQKEQENGRQHLFIVAGKDSVEFRNLRIQYLGTFSYKESYGGKISGIYVEGSDFFLARNVEASGFNRAGIDLATNANAPYNRYPKIENCYLHHNRVAGCMYGNNEGGEVRGNVFSHNGLEEDTGTGYGFAGASSSLPKNTLVENNSANYNIRKGLDFHSGENGIIKGNKCIGNRITGIFALNVKGRWEIANNLIDSMDGSKTTYHTVAAIEVGNRDRNKNPRQKIHFTIKNNIIDNFTGSKNNVSYPIYVQANSIGASSISISNNTIRGGEVTGIIRVNAGNDVISDYYDILIKDNILTAKTIGTPAIYLRGPNNRRKFIQNNRITILEDNQKVGYVILNDRSSTAENCYVVTNNKFNLPARNDPDNKLVAFRIQKSSTERINKNRVNNKRLDSWHGIDAKHVVNKLIEELLKQ